MNAPSLLRSVAGEESRGFDEPWFASLDWRLLDQAGELSRWRVFDARQQRHWLVLRCGVQAAHWEQALLDREYALAAYLSKGACVPPVARHSGVDGTLLVFDDEDGEPLSTQIEGALAVDDFLHLAIAVCDALADIHGRGLVHQDLRPANLLRQADQWVRLTGFAFACLADETAVAPPLWLDDCLAFQPPERSGSQRGDLYALGVCFFLWLTGRLPFDAQDPIVLQHQHAALPAPVPSTLRPGLPAALDQLCGELLAKPLDARPASAAQVSLRLRRYRDDWREHGDIHAGGPLASLGGALLGRQDELALLQQAGERLALGQGGALLIAGEAGLGKSALVRHWCVGEDSRRWLFAGHKCELVNRRRPYDALAGVFGALFLRLRGETPEAQQRWRASLRELAGRQASRLLQLIPQLTFWLQQVPASEIVSGEARRYLHGLLLRLLSLLAQRQRPLVLFLDDVQWIDEESLEFFCELPLELFEHVLLVTAFRPYDSLGSCPPERLLEACTALGSRTRRIDLLPLGEAEILDLLGCAGSLQEAGARRLLSYVAQQGGGNPLYLQQLAALQSETLAPGQVEVGDAAVDLARLLKARLARLPTDTRELLVELALLGNRTPLEQLFAATGRQLQNPLGLLRPALDANLLGEHPDGLAFSHDTLGEALRAGIAPERQQCLYLGFARNLMRQLSADEGAAAVFQVASLVLRAGNAARDDEGRRDFIELLLRAARLSAEAAAAGSALEYLAHAEQLLTGLADARLACAIDELTLRCLVLNADYVTADQRLSGCLAQSGDLLQRASLYRLRVEIHTLRGDYAQAIEATLHGLAELGLRISLVDLEAQADAAWGELMAALDGRTPDCFAALADNPDASQRAAQALLSGLLISGSFLYPGLMLLSASRCALLGLQHGLSAAVVDALGWLGAACSQRYECYALGFEFSACARQLLQRPEYASSRASTMMALGRVSAWTQPLPFSLECVELAYGASLDQGTPSLACYANNHMVSDLLVLGAPIERMLRQIDTGLAMARNLEFLDAQNLLYVQARYIRRLAGDQGSHLPIPDRPTLAARVAASHMGPLHFLWHLFEGLLRFLEGEFMVASESLDRAWTLAWAAPVQIHQIDLALFSVLNRAALQTQTGVTQDYCEPLRRLRQWARLNPRYFADRLALAEAELARLEGDGLRALRGYELAISHAQACGAIHIKGLAHELSARCQQMLGLQEGERYHLQRAHDAWRRWGATTLAEQLEARYDFLCASVAPDERRAAMPEQADRLAITRACQALSRQIEPQALIDTLLTTAALHARAGYVALLLLEAGQWRVAACGRADSKGMNMRQLALGDAVQTAPLSLLQQALESAEPVCVDGPDRIRRYAGDPYLAQVESGSLMCLPLLKQNDAVGVLYLENRLIAGAFDPQRIHLLELLAAQAAISLSNARLYADLLAENQRRRDSENTLQRTQALLALGQQVSRYGSFVWRPGLEPSFWSSRLLVELGWPAPLEDDHLRDPLLLVHPDDRSRVAVALRELVERQQPLNMEFRGVSSEASERFLELVIEPEGREAFIGVLSDVSERRQTDVALRTARAELERTARASVLGEMAASIAHEINQPLAAILSNAGASTRWLKRPEAQLEPALEGLADILAEGQRAAGIVRAMRELARQRPPQRKPLCLEWVVRQVLDICRAELEDKHVQVHLQLAITAAVEGDGIQLQQVLRNLIDNAVEAMQGLPAAKRRLGLQGLMVADQVLLLVEDSGPGVPPEHESSVFQAFVTTKGSGMGMGLAICSSIVNAHGGRIGSTRGRAGESLFYVMLPRAGRGA